MNAKHVWILIAMMALAFGCNDSNADKKNGDPWGFDMNGSDADNPDGGADGGGEDSGGEDFGRDAGGEDGGTPGAGPVFRLLNNDGTPVFAYHGAGMGQACGWGSFLEILEDGVSQRVQDDCSFCDCGTQEDCAVCAFDCAPGANPQYNQIEPGVARTFAWDGMFRVYDDAQSCMDQRAPQSTNLVARFCWGHSFEFTFDSWGDIADVECAEVPFDMNDELVEYVIEPSARELVTFTMTNTSRRHTVRTQWSRLGL